MSLTNRPLVFVSYSRKDSEAVGRLVEKLKTAGFPIWFDTHTITAGEWKRQIDEGLRRSQFFLACVSKNTNIRGEVLQYEWSNALEIQRKRLEGERYSFPC